MKCSDDILELETLLFRPLTADADDRESREPFESVLCGRRGVAMIQQQSTRPRRDVLSANGQGCCIYIYVCSDQPCIANMRGNRAGGALPWLQRVGAFSDDRVSAVAAID